MTLSGRLWRLPSKVGVPALSLAGAVYLALVVNLLTSLLAVIALLGYLYLYTPSKRKTPLSTLIGALAGAKVVEHDHTVARAEQPVDGVRSDEPGAPGNDHMHGSTIPRRW